MMENHDTYGIQRTRLKDYSPQWQTRYMEAQIAAPEPEPEEQAALAVPGTHHDVSYQETQPSLLAAPAPDALREHSSLAVSSPVKLPALSIPSRLAGGKSRRSQRMSLALCLAVFLAACGIYGWMRVKALPPAVVVYQVGAQTLPQDIGGGGIVYPLQQEDISYPIAERALAVLVAPGEHVSAGQSLIQLDMAQLNAQIEQAHNDVLSTGAYLKSVKASGTAFDVAQAQQSYDLAENKYLALKAEASSSTLHNGTVVSPINGIVTSLYIAPGEIFAANKTMIVIMDESKVIVRTEMPLSYLGLLQIGQSATVTPSSLSGVSLPGKLSAIIPRADPQTDTFEIWVTVANPQQLLLPGMSAFVHIQKVGKVLVIPRLAVLNPDREGIVFLERDGRAYIQKVRITARSLAKLYIGSGISPGDRVIVVGLDSLQNGQKVRVAAVES